MGAYSDLARFKEGRYQGGCGFLKVEDQGGGGHYIDPPVSHGCGGCGAIGMEYLFQF